MENMNDVATDPRMPPGSRYAGQPIDVSSRRSLIIVDADDRQLSTIANRDHVVVDYFYHDGQFWRAVVPLGSVAEVYGQAFNFSRIRTQTRNGQPEKIFDEHGIPKYQIPILNHVQVRFQLRDPHMIKLYPLGSETTGEPHHAINDFVYSLEAVGPTGIYFNLRDGMAGNLVSAHRYMSTVEMVFERLVVERMYVTESPPLKLDDIDKQELLWKSLVRCHAAGMTETYYLFRPCGTNNCTSSPFSILDRVVRYPWANRLGAVLYRLPLSPRFYLRVRGLDSDPTQRKLVRREFTDYIEEPTTQARKREYVKRLMKIKRMAKEAEAGS